MRDLYFHMGCVITNFGKLVAKFIVYANIFYGNFGVKCRKKSEVGVLPTFLF